MSKFLKNNRKFTSGRRVMQILSEQNREIFIQNIPKLLKLTNFSRSELHSTYILYKVLQDVTSLQYKYYGNFHFFRNKKKLIKFQIIKNIANMT